MARPAHVLMRTPRLSMREFTPADFDDMLRLDSDPRVLKYINGGKPMGRAEVEAAVKRVTGYYALYPGLGVWRASRRDNGAFVGWYCLKYCPPTTDVEVGYRLLFDAWGNGFATEGARALVDYGFEQLGLQRVIGSRIPGTRRRSMCFRSPACTMLAGGAITTVDCVSSSPTARRGASVLRSSLLLARQSRSGSCVPGRLAPQGCP